jgi:hypothetical protein
LLFCNLISLYVKNKEGKNVYDKRLDKKELVLSLDGRFAVDVVVGEFAGAMLGDGESGRGAGGGWVSSI